MAPKPVPAIVTFPADISLLRLTSKAAHWSCALLCPAKTGDLSAAATLFTGSKRSYFTPANYAEAALIGLGGISKTQIALQLAYLTWQRQPGLLGALGSSAQLRRCPQGVLQYCLLLCVPSVDNLLWQRLSLDSAGRWLFILDNIDDSDMLLQPQADASQAAQLERDMF
jgi:hypothetical protein